ncbi:MAG: LamB/YcsF family protein [Verrucomicrobia bacterium]|nr:LamB/YcsF family protein [Verrucomicrobiota bacterium]
MKQRIDLNCDLGEGAGHDAALMPLITSANIACGAHAGDETTMRATIALAKQHGVAIGAHPGFADRENFGRREFAVTPREASGLVLLQIQKLQELVIPFGAWVTHIKLHGALYNLASRDERLARAVVEAVRVTDKTPTLFVLAGSVLERIAREDGDIKVVAEVFADRTYQRDGSLTPRSRPDALIHDERVAVAQALRLVREGVVRATDGTDVPIAADTVCLHGDGPDPVGFARRLRAGLAAAGIAVVPVSA